MENSLCNNWKSSFDAEDSLNPKEAITIVVEKLELEPNVLAKKDIEKIFVSYEFLRYPVRDLETIALPKDENPFVYNFTRSKIVFSVDNF